MINKQQLLERVDILLQGFVENGAETGDVEQIKAWHKKIQDLQLIEDLKEHEGVKIFLSGARSMFLEGIVSALQNKDSQELSDTKRDAMLMTRDFIIWILSLFSDIDTEIEQIEKMVAENEEYFRSNYPNYGREKES